MTAQPTQPIPGRRHGGARIAALVAAGLIAVVSAGLVAAGAWGLWGDAVKKDDHGYITSASHRYASAAHAITTDNLDMDVDGPGDLVGESAYGSLRLKVAPSSGKPVFVGIARTREVNAYLGHTARDLVKDLEFSPFRADYDHRAGRGRPAAPGSRDIWAASAQGSGTQTLTWDVEDGDWSVVVMNADASAGVHAAVSAGVKLPWLTPLAWSVLGAGLLGLLMAALITVPAIRSPRRSPELAPVPA